MKAPQKVHVQAVSPKTLFSVDAAYDAVGRQVTDNVKTLLPKLRERRAEMAQRGECTRGYGYIYNQEEAQNIEAEFGEAVDEYLQRRIREEIMDPERFDLQRHQKRTTILAKASITSPFIFLGASDPEIEAFFTMVEEVIAHEFGKNRQQAAGQLSNRVIPSGRQLR